MRQSRQLNYLILDGPHYGPQTSAMSLRFLFWLIMLLWLVFGLIVPHWGAFAWTMAGSLLEFILFAILGWQVFGAPISRE